jgi:hypothetical protein
MVPRNRRCFRATGRPVFPHPHGRPFNEYSILLNGRRVWLNDRRIPLNAHRVRLNDRRLSLNVHRVWLNDLRLSLNDRRIPPNAHRISLNGHRIWLNAYRVSPNGYGDPNRDLPMRFAKACIACFQAGFYSITYQL